MDLNETQILNDRRDDSDKEKNQVGTLFVGISEYQIIQGFNRIGRTRPCSIVLDDTTVSRVHAEIHAGSESAFITDLGSVNGTTLKDLTLKHFYFYPINDGDVIIFGGVKAIFARTKQLSRSKVEKTTRTPVETGSLRGPRESPYSLPRLAIDSTFDESNGSVVMGSQQTDPQRRLFRQPAMPVNRSINSARISETVNSPGWIEDPDRSRKGNVSPDIYIMETQNILAPETPGPNKETQVKKTTKPDASSKNVDQSVEDVHEMETQNMLEPVLQPRSGKILSGSSKRNFAPEKYRRNVNHSSDVYDAETQSIVDREAFVPPKRFKLEKTAEVTVQETDDSVYEAETQVLGMPEKKAKMVEDCYTDDENIAEENAPKEPSVIAETDDESKSEDEINEPSRRGENNDLSDGSITDDENNFATLSTEIEARTKAKVSPQTRTVSSALKNQSQPGTNPQKTTFPRASSTTRIVDDESDLDLLPTQVLDVMTSTPMSRRWNVPTGNIDESQVVLDDMDIHNALTQVAPANAENSPDSSTEIPEKMETIEPTKENGSRNEDPNPNDTLEKNMGNIFGNDLTSEGEPTDEPTQLMTQNLVDILKPTQIPVRETTPSPTIPESPEKAKSPKEKENESREILGFVDGRAVDSQNRVSCALKTTTADTSVNRPGNSEEKTLERANSDLSLPPCSEDDDIFIGLPKVRISGTLSNPGSPASSETSENDLDWLKKRGNHGKTGSRTKSKSFAISTRSKVDETRDEDSPVLCRKSRVMGKNISCNRIGEDDDNDSDDDLDYNELKKIADRLLASGSSTETNVRKATGFPGLNVERSLPTNQTNRRPTRKLSETPSSLTVTDPNESDTSEDASENTVVQSSTRASRKRPRESAKKTRARKRTMKKESPKESRKVDDPVGPNDRLTPVMTQKQHAQVHLTRINVSELKAKKAELLESKIATPKDTRLTITKTANDPTPSPTTPSRSRGRRTIEPNVSLTKQHHKVLFTGVKDEDYEKMVVKLGGTVVSDPSKATVLITDKVRRTFKFLCAVAQGIQVVSVNWLVESFNAGHSLDCDTFILQDAEAEEKFNFKLARSLNAARKKKFLSGFTILITPKVNQPEIHEIKGMVEASGGRVLVRIGVRSWSEKMVILSRKDDLAAAKAIISKAPKGTKISVQSTEFLLTGILRQEVNFVDYKLL